VQQESVQAPVYKSFKVSQVILITNIKRQPAGCLFYCSEVHRIGLILEEAGPDTHKGPN
jgi:hypothetical protein